MVWNCFWVKAKRLVSSLIVQVYLFFTLWKIKILSHVISVQTRTFKGLFLLQKKYYRGYLVIFNVSFFCYCIFQCSGSIPFIFLIKYILCFQLYGHLFVEINNLKSTFSKNEALLPLGKKNPQSVYSLKSKSWGEIRFIIKRFGKFQ